MNLFNNIFRYQEEDPNDINNSTGRVMDNFPVNVYSSMNYTPISTPQPDLNNVTNTANTYNTPAPQPISQGNSGSAYSRAQSIRGMIPSQGINVGGLYRGIFNLVGEYSKNNEEKDNYRKRRLGMQYQAVQPYTPYGIESSMLAEDGKTIPANFMPEDQPRDPSMYFQSTNQNTNIVPDPISSPDMDNMFNNVQIPQPITSEYSGTFSKAFAQARADLGAGQEFVWQGKKYTTNFANEVVPNYTPSKNQKIVPKNVSNTKNVKSYDKQISKDPAYIMADRAIVGPAQPVTGTRVGFPGQGYDRAITSAPQPVPININNLSMISGRSSEVSGEDMKYMRNLSWFLKNKSGNFTNKKGEKIQYDKLTPAQRRKLSDELYTYRHYKYEDGGAIPYDPNQPMIINPMLSLQPGVNYNPDDFYPAPGPINQGGNYYNPRYREFVPYEPYQAPVPQPISQPSTGTVPLNIYAFKYDANGRQILGEKELVETKTFNSYKEKADWLKASQKERGYGLYNPGDLTMTDYIDTRYNNPKYNSNKRKAEYGANISTNIHELSIEQIEYLRSLGYNIDLV